MIARSQKRNQLSKKFKVNYDIIATTEMESLPTSKFKPPVGLEVGLYTIS